MSKKKEERKVCPLLSKGRFGLEWCIGEKCAWYCQREYDSVCAILEIAECVHWVFE